MKHTVTLRNGVQVPALGLGTWFLGENKSAREREQESLRAGVAAGMTLMIQRKCMEMEKRKVL